MEIGGGEGEDEIPDLIEMKNESIKIPVTILMGFLGSGRFIYKHKFLLGPTNESYIRENYAIESYFNPEPWLQDSYNRKRVQCWARYRRNDSKEWRRWEKYRGVL